MKLSHTDSKTRIIYLNKVINTSDVKKLENLEKRTDILANIVEISEQFDIVKKRREFRKYKSLIESKQKKAEFAKQCLQEEKDPEIIRQLASKYSNLFTTYD